MKEELIKELVANSKFTNRINIQYQHKIDSLNKEITQYKAEISDLQFQLQNQSNLITARDPSKTEKYLNTIID
jgi:flagellar biosynthesis chaperone FliJ